MQIPLVADRKMGIMMGHGFTAAHNVSLSTQTFLFAFSSLITRTIPQQEGVLCLNLDSRKQDASANSVTTTYVSLVRPVDLSALPVDGLYLNHHFRHCPVSRL
jgi:hypothetical protein